MQTGSEPLGPKAQVRTRYREDSTETVVLHEGYLSPGTWNPPLPGEPHSETTEEPKDE